MSETKEGGPVEEQAFRILVHNDDDGSLWAEVPDMPGVFASGQTTDELFEAVAEAITMASLDDLVRVEVEKLPDGAVATKGVTRESQPATRRKNPDKVAEVVPLAKRRAPAEPHRFRVREVDLLIEA